MRKGSIKRLSKETNIQISLTIEGHGRYQISTGIRFFDHMLELFAHHGGFDLKLKARGDLDVDQHHTVEDVGIVLGQAFDKALGSKRGILHNFQPHHRLAVAPLGFVSVEARAGCLFLSAFHTFPDEHTVVKTQSLIERKG